MPLLMSGDNRWQFREMQAIRIGSDADQADVVLPAALGVAPQHALITRSALNRLLLVVDLGQGAIMVNDHPITRLRVLRQGDLLRLGSCTLTVWEVQIRRLSPGDDAIGRTCPVSRRTLQAGDEVIACPGCGTVHERAAWFLIEHCAAGCGYPNRVVVMDTLSAEIRLERNLDQDSTLIEKQKNGKIVQDGTYCQAGQARDQVPFQPRQNVAYCPSCSTPFHLECFLNLAECPVCKHDNKALFDRLFMAEEQASHVAG